MIYPSLKEREQYKTTTRLLFFYHSEKEVILDTAKVQTHNTFEDPTLDRLLISISRDIIYILDNLNIFIKTFLFDTKRTSNKNDDDRSEDNRN